MKRADVPKGETSARFVLQEFDGQKAFASVFFNEFDSAFRFVSVLY